MNEVNMRNEESFNEIRNALTHDLVRNESVSALESFQSLATHFTCIIKGNALVEVQEIDGKFYLFIARAYDHDNYSYINYFRSEIDGITQSQYCSDYVFEEYGIPSFTDAIQRIVSVSAY